MSYDLIKPRNDTFDATVASPIVYLTNAGWVARHRGHDRITGKDFAEVLVAFSPRMGTLGGVDTIQQVFQTITIADAFTTPSNADTTLTGVTLNITFDSTAKGDATPSTQTVSTSGLTFSSTLTEITTAIIAAINASTSGVNVEATSTTGPNGESAIMLGFKANAFDSEPNPNFNFVTSMGSAYTKSGETTETQVVGINRPTISLGGQVPNLFATAVNGTNFNGQYLAFSILNSSDKLAIGLLSAPGNTTSFPLSKIIRNPDPAGRFSNLGPNVWAPHFGPLPNYENAAGTQGVTLTDFSFKSRIGDGRTLEVRINGARLVQGISTDHGRPNYLSRRDLFSFSSFLIGGSSTSGQFESNAIASRRLKRMDILKFEAVESVEILLGPTGGDTITFTDGATLAKSHPSSSFTDSTALARTINNSAFAGSNSRLLNEYNSTTFVSFPRESYFLSNYSNTIWGVDLSWDGNETLTDPFIVDTATTPPTVTAQQLPLGEPVFGEVKVAYTQVVDGTSSNVEIDSTSAKMVQSSTTESEVQTITFTGTPVDSQDYDLSIAVAKADGTFETAVAATTFTTDATATLAEFAALVNTNLATLTGEATISYTAGDEFLTLTYSSNIDIPNLSTITITTGTGVTATVVATQQGGQSDFFTAVTAQQVVSLPTGDQDIANSNTIKPIV